MGQLTDLDPILYGQLLSVKLPRKISSDEQYDRLADEVEKIDFDSNACPEERAYSGLATDLLLRYDQEFYPVPVLAPLDLLRHLMESNHISQAELGRLPGVARATASQIYHGQRGISKQVAIKLSQRFKLSVAAFIG